jgi:hypothetical protein
MLLFNRKFDTKKIIYSILFLMIIFLIQKIVLARFLYDNVAIETLGFGMGGYVESLKAGNGFKNCDALNMCNYSSRMPGVPLIIYIFSFFSDNQLGVSFFKSIAFSAICLIIFIRIKQNNTFHRINNKILTVYLGTYLIMVLMPPLAKHSAAIIYEEAYFIELLIPWIVINSIIIEGIIKRYPLNFDKFNSLNIILSFSFFMIKSSMIVLFLWAILLFAVGLFLRFTSSKRKQSFLMLSVCIILSSTWVVHNVNKGGGIKIMSSWDGENLFRGNNPVSAKIYPDISLDRLTDSNMVILRNGNEVFFPTFPSRKNFENEWEWSAYYKGESLKWVQDDFIAWSRFQASKAFNFFLSFKMTPFSVDTDARISERTLQQLAYDSLIMFWLLLGRIFFFSSIFLILREVSTYGIKANAHSLFLLIPTTLYAAPYIIGVNYERHISPFLLMYVVLFFILITIHEKKVKTVWRK